VSFSVTEMLKDGMVVEDEDLEPDTIADVGWTASSVTM
jgi:hypothetical protein